jgi:ariadne-1
MVSLFSFACGNRMTPCRKSCVIGSAPSDDDMELDAFGDDFRVASKGKHKPYELEYHSLSQSDVEKLMQQDVDHITGIFGVDVSTYLQF